MVKVGQELNKFSMHDERMFISLCRPPFIYVTKFKYDRLISHSVVGRYIVAY